MAGIGVQTKEIVSDAHPEEGFAMMRQAGFSCGDFSLNSYLVSGDLYQGKLNTFFDKTQRELEQFFTPHKRAAQEAGITIHQMHMPYPVYVPRGSSELNDYLWNVMAPKSMKLCAFLGCRYIVVHGFKMMRYAGSEEAEWEMTEKLLNFLAPLAKELGITMCVENLYDVIGGHLVEGPCCNAVKAVRRIDSFNERYQAEVLGFCFDTGHAMLTGLDFEDFLTALGSRLKVLHIHDNDGISDLHRIPFTFTKACENQVSSDWEGLIRGLRNIKFDKVLSFETSPALTAFPGSLKGDALELIARIGGYFSDRIWGGTVD